MVAPTAIATVRRRTRPRSSAPTSPATIAMFQPEMATTWLAPAVAKSAASARSTRSRRPMRMPAASPASGSGRAVRSVSPAASRSAWSETASGSRTTVARRASRLPAAPVLRRYSPYGSSSGGGRSRPSTSTIAPARNVGKDGRVAATITGPGTTSRARRATWAPSRGDPVEVTSAVHGPDPPGSGAAGGLAGPKRTRSPSRIAPAPDAAGTSHGPRVCCRPASPRASVARPAARIASPGTPIHAPPAAAAAPAAAHALRGTRAGAALTGRR